MSVFLVETYKSGGFFISFLIRVDHKIVMITTVNLTVTGRMQSVQCKGLDLYKKKYLRKEKRFIVQDVNKRGSACAVASTKDICRVQPVTLTVA
jgi:hypothetical protein